MGNFSLDKLGLLALAVQFVIPVLVGLVTTRVTNSGVKAVLLLLLTAVAQFLLAIAQPGSGIPWTDLLWSAGVGFVIAVAAHFGLWKPTGVSDAATNSLVKSP